MGHEDGHVIALKYVDLARGGGGVDMPAVEGKVGMSRCVSGGERQRGVTGEVRVE